MTNINLSQIVTETAAAVQKELMALIPSTIAVAVNASNIYIKDFEERTATLLGVIVDETFKGDKLKYAITRWNDEKEILKSEVFSFIIIGEGVLQAAVNSVQNILISAVQSVLPATSL